MTPSTTTGAATLPQRPALHRRFRLQWEAAQQCDVLLYPEGMVRLNGSAGAILKCCDGASTVDQIVAALELEYGRGGLRADIEALLQHAQREGWIA